MPLTLTTVWQALRATFILSLLLFISVVGTSSLFLTGILFVAPLWRKGWRKYTGMFIDWFMILVVFYIEVWNGIVVTCTGDFIPAAERALIVCNHPTELDWLVFWPLAARKGMLGSFKVAMKKVMRYVPGVGWAMDTLEWIFLDRDWALDEPALKHRLNSWVEDDYRLWLFFFPEGTDFTEAKHQKSITFAKQEGRQSFRHLLTPKTKGFTTCMDILRSKLDAVYDLTIAYPCMVETEANNNRTIHPNFGTAILSIAPRAAHVHIRRWKMSELPQEEEQLVQWLDKCYQEKDELLDYFKHHSKFPSGSNGREILHNDRWIMWTWFFFWIIMGGIWAYLLWLSPLFVAVVLFGIALQVTSSVSARVRSWRGIEPKRIGTLVGKGKKKENAL